MPAPARDSDIEVHGMGRSGLKQVIGVKVQYFRCPVAVAFISGEKIDLETPPESIPCLCVVFQEFLERGFT